MGCRSDRQKRGEVCREGGASMLRNRGSGRVQTVTFGAMHHNRSCRRRMLEGWIGRMTGTAQDNFYMNI